MNLKKKIIKKEEQLIKQAAEDYDIPYDIVKLIRENNPDYFYQSLDEYIRFRDEVDFKLKNFNKNNE
jgi:hypothetical protein